MKTFTPLAAVAALSISTVSAFPAIALEAAQIAARDVGSSTTEKLAHERRLLGILPGFDAAAQRIDVSGEHKFIPPTENELRGPCPGLNALGMLYVLLRTNNILIRASQPQLPAP